MAVKDELNAMFDVLEGKYEGVEPTDAPTTTQPVDQGGDDKTEPPKTEAPTTEEPAGDTETDAPTTSAPVDEAARLKAENEELRRRIEEATKKAPKTEPPSTDAPIADQNFLDGIDVTDFEDKPEELNKVLNTIYKRAIEVVRGELKQTKDVIIRTVPKVISDDAEAHKRMKALSEKFYTENPDLKTFPKVVGTVFDELSSSNKGKPLEEILSSVGTEVRNRLGIKKPDKKTTNQDKDNPPNLPRKRGARRVQSQNQETNPLASEISEMNKSLNL